jgi:hypothetical protein
MSAIIRRTWERATILLGMRPLGPSHSMFVSYTGDQVARVNDLSARVEPYLQLLHYKRNLQTGRLSVADEIEGWIARADVSIGIYGSKEGFDDEGLGQPVTHWEYERIVASRGLFRPFIDVNAHSGASAVQQAFLAKLTQTTGSRVAETFSSSSDFVQKAEQYVGLVIASISQQRKGLVELLLVVIGVLILLLVLAIAMNPELRNGL